MKTTEWKTDDLRQVISQQHGFICVQRRWLVATGETYNSESGPKHADHRDVTDYGPPGNLAYYIPRYAVTREEWRDLPCVSSR